ncbi:hypothetical protein CVT26_005065 [Gymnopilus dilepis]|uniref:PCI domain-containing protein n=1 Tax=Gymnopilus dilepis TaxID=231916 RepID=A0A409Y0F6_9AGAR|nr:hypothetical protein CVT26_005065 [Gymnopilus dilepis]
MDIVTPKSALGRRYLFPSRILAPHTRYYIREMHILTYTQLLESYRSLTLESLSAAFGVSQAFVDTPSLKPAQYETVIQQGDVWLKEVLRLNKVLY